MKTFLQNTPKALMKFVFIIFFPATLSAQWSAPVNLSPAAVNAGMNESMGCCLAANGDTLHLVGYDKISATRSVLYYSHSLDTGLTWSAPVAITSPVGNAWNPAIAVCNNTVHIVWREIDPANNHRAS